jgi:hypothetical protein
MNMEEVTKDESSLFLEQGLFVKPEFFVDFVYG